MQNWAIEVKNLSVSYSNNPVLTDVNLSVKTGAFLGIMGPNGGGKSTFLKTLLGLVPYQKGKISLLGKPLQQGRLKVGYVPQFALVDRKFPITVIEVVKSGLLEGALHPFFRFSKKQEKIALQKMEETGIIHLAKRQITALSGGEFQRMLIARALVSDPQILFLDEPTASVDPASREQIFSILYSLNSGENPKTILLVTHDMAAIATQIKELACLNRTLVYHGQPKLTQAIVDRLYGCPVDLIAHGVAHRILTQHSASEGYENCTCGEHQC